MAGTFGSKSSIGGTAVTLVASTTPVFYGVWIKAAAGNAGTVYLSNSSAVTANSADATDGYQMVASAEFHVPANDIAGDLVNLYLIASQSSQKVFFFAV